MCQQQTGQMSVISLQAMSGLVCIPRHSITDGILLQPPRAFFSSAFDVREGPRASTLRSLSSQLQTLSPSRLSAHGGFAFSCLWHLVMGLEFLFYKILFLFFLFSNILQGFLWGFSI